MLAKQTLFSFKQCREDLLLQHPPGEFGELFVCGTKETKPHILEIDTRIAFPWRSAMLTITLIFISMIILFIEHISRVGIGNFKTFMGLIMVGSIATPLGLLCGIVEMNIKRNVAWIFILWLVLIGGFISILFTIVNPIWGIFGPIIGSAIAGPIEESTKLITVLLLVNKKKRDGQILRGLIYGAAVAAGFSIIESIGYAFESLLSGKSSLQYEAAIGTMSMRAIYNLFGGHIAYTALSTGALWMCMKGGSLRSALKRPLFIMCFILSMFIHALWNFSFDASMGQITLIFPIIAWVPIIWLIKKGVEQIRQEQDEWKINHSETTAILWHKPLGQIPRGPYTLAEMKQLHTKGNIQENDSYLIGNNYLRQSSIGKIIPQISNEAVKQDSWLDSKNTPAFIWLNILGTCSAVCLLSSPVFLAMLVGYLASCSLIFITLLRLNVNAWRRLDQTNPANTPPINTGKRLWLKLFIPIYQIYWFYIFCVKLVNIYNQGEAKRKLIPLWIPKLYWWTCSLSIVCIIMSLGGAKSPLFYLIFLVFFYSVAAYLMSLALRQILQKT